MRNKEIYEPDIIRKIYADFKEVDLAEALAILARQYSDACIVGSAQFVRSLIFLSKGDLNFLKNYIVEMDDPRDVVTEAENAAGNPDHWFCISFDEIEKSDFVSNRINGEHAYWDSQYQAEKEFEEYQKEQNIYWDFFFQNAKDLDDYSY